MTDDAAAALAEIRERNERRIRFYAYTDYTVEHDAAEGDVRRLLAALDKVLELHAPTSCKPCADFALSHAGTGDRLYLYRLVPEEGS